MRVTCPGRAKSCDGRVRILNGQRIVGETPFLIDGSHSQTLTVNLGRRLHGRKRLRVVAYSRDANGIAVQTAKSFTFRLA